MTWEETDYGYRTSIEGLNFRVVKGKNGRSTLWVENIGYPLPLHPTSQNEIEGMINEALGLGGSSCTHAGFPVASDGTCIKCRPAPQV